MQNKFSSLERNWINFPACPTLTKLSLTVLTLTVHTLIKAFTNSNHNAYTDNVDTASAFINSGSNDIALTDSTLTEL